MIASAILELAAAAYCGLYGGYCLKQNKRRSACGALLLAAVCAACGVWLLL